MKALSVRAYWAWAIGLGVKPFENRGWATSYRGPLAIHAGLSRADDGAARTLLESLGLSPPDPDEISRGAILAVAHLVDVVEYDPRRPLLFDEHGLNGSPFAHGPKVWILENARLLAAPVHWRGQQSLFDVELPAAALSC